MQSLMRIELVRTATFACLLGAGLAQAQAPAAVAPLWSDLDGDELPDLYLLRPGRDDVVLRNLGDGRFADVTAEAGLAGNASRAIHALDFDGDERADLLLVGSTGGLRLFRGEGEGAFTEATRAAGLGFAQKVLRVDQAASSMKSGSPSRPIVTGPSTSRSISSLRSSATCSDRRRALSPMNPVGTPSRPPRQSSVAKSSSFVLSSPSSTSSVSRSASRPSWPSSRAVRLGSKGASSAAGDTRRPEAYSGPGACVSALPAPLPDRAAAAARPPRRQGLRAG